MLRVSKFVLEIKMVPFKEAITISSICNKVFRAMFLKPDTVGIIRGAGYRMGDRQSIERLQWLANMVRTRKIHTGNGREMRLDRVPNVKVDRYCRDK
jgi:hypothetical protein